MPPTNTKDIRAFLHCALCIKEEVQANLEVGWTPVGLQVWCRNHNANVIHVDFEGHKHQANTTRIGPKTLDS